MAAPEVAGDPGAGWDEAQCTAALAQLEQLQEQINDLRLAIPRIIEPFQRPATPATFKLYAKGVLGSQDNVKSLNQKFRDTEMQSVFEHTKKSLAANTDLSTSMSIPSYGWTEREKKARGAHETSRSESTEESGSSLTDGEVAQLLGEFQTTHPTIKLETQDDNRTIIIQFVSASVKLRFRVAIEHEANGGHKLNAECPGAAEPWISINRCIASRPQPNDLKNLLDMIAAYKTVKGTSCAKCGRFLDRLALPPSARRSKQTATTSEDSTTVWQAFHESCLD